MGRPKKLKQVEEKIEQQNELPIELEVPKYLEVLKKYKYIYDMFYKTGEIVGLHPHIREEIVSAYKVKFPHFHYQKTCAACTGDMLKEVYTWYENYFNNL